MANFKLTYKHVDVLKRFAAQIGATDKEACTNRASLGASWQRDNAMLFPANSIDWLSAYAGLVYSIHLHPNSTTQVTKELPPKLAVQSHQHRGSDDAILRSLPPGITIGAENIALAISVLRQAGADLQSYPRPKSSSKSRGKQQVVSAKKKPQPKPEKKPESWESYQARQDGMTKWRLEHPFSGGFGSGKRS